VQPQESELPTTNMSTRPPAKELPIMRNGMLTHPRKANSCVKSRQHRHRLHNQFPEHIPNQMEPAPIFKIIALLEAATVHITLDVADSTLDMADATLGVADATLDVAVKSNPFRI